MPDDSPENAYYLAFEQVCAFAPGYELRARLCADLSPTSNGLAVDGNLERILRHLKSTYLEALSETEWDELDQARKLRNKLFHGELHSASKMVGSPIGGVRIGTFPPQASGHDILAVIEELAAGGGSFVSGMITSDAGVFGWVLECATSGAFEKMAALFTQAKSYMSRLAKFISSRT